MTHVSVPSADVSGHAPVGRRCVPLRHCLLPVQGGVRLHVARKSHPQKSINHAHRSCAQSKVQSDLFNCDGCSPPLHVQNQNALLLQPSSRVRLSTFMRVFSSRSVTDRRRCAALNLYAEHSTSRHARKLLCPEVAAHLRGN